MDTFSITYTQTKTKEMVLKQIKEICDKQSLDCKDVWRLLHIMAYSAVFLIPEQFRESGRPYSIEDICSYQIGLVNKEGLHDILYTIGLYDNPMHDKSKSVLRVVNDPLAPEVLRLLRLPADAILHSLQQYLDERS